VINEKSIGKNVEGNVTLFEVLRNSLPISSQDNGTPTKILNRTQNCK